MGCGSGSHKVLPSEKLDVALAPEAGVDIRSAQLVASYEHFGRAVGSM